MKLKKVLCKCGCGGLTSGKFNHNINKYGEYLPGHNKSMLGRTHSKESKAIMRQKALGRKFTPEQRIRMGIVQRGRKHSEETKKKMSLNHRGSLNPMYGRVTRGAFKKGENLREKNIKWKGGLPKCPICHKILTGYKYKHCKRHRPATYKGEAHYMWKGGITRQRDKEVRLLAYKEWRDSVFKRDDYICQFCGKRGGLLQADHIKPFAYFASLRLDPDNGRTLCMSCHKKTDTYGFNARRNYG